MKMNKKLILLVGLILAISATLPITSVNVVKAEDPDPKYGGTLIMWLRGDPLSMNPIMQSDDTLGRFSTNLYDSLCSRNYETGEVKPQIAESWSLSEDGLTWTFNLRDDAYWHDGEKVMADDVKFSLDYISEHGVWAWMKKMESTEVIDDYTLAIHLLDKYPAWLTNMAAAPPTILPAHIYEGTDQFENPHSHGQPGYPAIGSGPFKFVEWVRDDHIILAANPDYWGGRPNVERLAIKIVPEITTALAALEAGQLDIIDMATGLQSEVSRLVEDPNVHVSMTDKIGTGIWFLAFNLQNDIIDNVEVRQALSYAIDRQEVVDAVLYGLATPCPYMLPPAQWDLWLNPDVNTYEYNPSLAEQMLDDAGYPRGTDGIRFSISDMHWNYAPMPDLYTILAEQLSDIGVDLLPQELERPTWNDRMASGEFETIQSDGWVLFDPSGLDSRWHSGSIPRLNLHWYNNSVIDDLLELGNTEMDLAERKKIYDEVQEILQNDAGQISIYVNWDIRLTRAEVHGASFEEALRVGGSWAKVWLDSGFEYNVIEDAKTAIDLAESEDRTEGLDEAQTIYENAITAFNDARYEDAEELAGQAKVEADAAESVSEPVDDTDTEKSWFDSYGLVTIAIVAIIAIAAYMYYKKSAKTS